MRRGVGAATATALTLALTAAAGQATPFDSALNQLGSFDLVTRTAAARTLRRADAATVVPALTAAARDHRDGYVRYRALVLLSGFGSAAASETMRALLADPNDRVRVVAYAWFEHNPDDQAVPALLAALEREQAEFVRPALIRAVASAAAHDARARAPLLAVASTGPEIFRGSAVTALGDYRGVYATELMSQMVTKAGPLQREAVLAAGRMGERGLLPALDRLRREGPRELEPALVAALCQLGVSCGAAEDFLRQTLIAGVASGKRGGLAREGAQGLAALAVAGRAGALNALFEVSASAADAPRSEIALAVGLVALRSPVSLLASLESRPDRGPALDLLRDAFDQLSSEDFEQEQFYLAVRRLYWESPAGSTRRQIAEAVIQKLEF